MFSRVRWLLVWMLFIGGVINYMDRSAISIAAPLVAKELNLNPSQLGLMFSIFFLGYAPFCFIGGYLSDRLGPKRVFGLSMSWWSIFCGLTAAAFSFGSLLVVRVLFGIGEGPLSSTTNKFVSQWFPRREQASAIGVATAGTPLGGALAGPVVGMIAIHFGWRASFVAIAIIGLLFTVAWMLFATDRPGGHRWITATERAEIRADQPPPDIQAASKPLLYYLRQPTVLSTAFAFFGYAFLLYFFLAWFPSYLTMVHHLGVKDMSLVTAIPWLMGFLGLALGGFVADFVSRRTGRTLFGRKLVLVTCMALAAVCVALAGEVTTVQSAVVLMAVSTFFLFLSCNTYWAIVLDTVESGKIGSVGGFIHFVANLAGIVSPAITGFIVQWTGSFAGAFVLAGAVASIGAFAVAFWVHPLGDNAAGSIRKVVC